VLVKLDDLAGRTTITVPQAGEVLGIGRDAAYAAAKKGDIPTLHIGRRVLVPVPALLAMLGANADNNHAKIPAQALAESLAEAVEHQNVVKRLMRLADARVAKYQELYGKAAGHVESPPEFVSSTLCKAKRRGGEDCDHWAMPGSDYCRTHAGTPPGREG
jgi:hypothetical protein